jgi:hypothetical protein
LPIAVTDALKKAYPDATTKHLSMRQRVPTRRDCRKKVGSLFADENGKFKKIKIF